MRLRNEKEMPTQSTHAFLQGRCAASARMKSTSDLSCSTRFLLTALFSIVLLKSSPATRAPGETCFRMCNERSPVPQQRSTITRPDAHCLAQNSRQVSSRVQVNMRLSRSYLSATLVKIDLSVISNIALSLQTRYLPLKQPSSKHLKH